MSQIIRNGMDRSRLYWKHWLSLRGNCCAEAVNSCWSCDLSGEKQALVVVIFQMYVVVCMVFQVSYLVFILLAQCSTLQ